MQNPSKTDCIAILSAARELRDGSLISLDPKALGLSRNGMDTAMSFLLERACFTSFSAPMTRLPQRGGAPRFRGFCAVPARGVHREVR